MPGTAVGRPSETGRPASPVRWGGAVAIGVVAFAAAFAAGLPLLTIWGGFSLRLDPLCSGVGYLGAVLVCGLIGAPVLRLVGVVRLGWPPRQARRAGWAAASTAVLIGLAECRSWLQLGLWPHLALAWLLALAVLCLVLACLAGAAWRRVLRAGVWPLAALALLAVPTVFVPSLGVVYVDPYVPEPVVSDGGQAHLSPPADGGGPATPATDDAGAR